MFLGSQVAAAPFVVCSKISTLIYFAYFMMVKPSLGYFENTILSKKIYNLQA